MATSINSQVQAPTEETLTEIEHSLQLKECQLAREYGKTNTALDIGEHLKTLKSLPLTTASNAISEMDDRLKFKEKRSRAKANYDLITKTEQTKIPSTISNDKSLINSIKTLDNTSKKLPALRDNSSLSQMYRGNVSIKSTDDAWIYSLNPSENLILPLKRKDIQTKCRSCNSEVQTSMAPTTDFLLCENHQRDLNQFAGTIKSIYGSEFDAQPPTDRTQFHLNLYGPVLNRFNIIIQQLKTQAAESEQLDIKKYLWTNE